MSPFDLVVRSKNVFRSFPGETEPTEACIGICGNTIAWVGILDDIDSSLIGPETKIIDAGESLVMPGFHDAHIHFLHSAFFDSDRAAHIVGTSERDAVDSLREFAKGTDDSSWLMSHGWRQACWEDGSTPSKASLDSAFPDRPVAMYSGDAHTLWVNSVALDLLQRKGAVDAEDEGLMRDDLGKLTGVIRESAAMRAMSHILSSLDAKELAEMYASFARRLSQEGITSICDVALSPISGADFIRQDIYAQLEDEGRLPLRANLFPALDHSLSKSDAECEASDLVRVQGRKQFFDGVTSQHTAWMREPYANAWFEGDSGSPSIEPERLRLLVQEAAEEGVPCRIHAIGSASIHEAIKMLKDNPIRGKHSIEHLECLEPDDIANMAESTIVASVQPCHVTLEPDGPAVDVGHDMAVGMWPFRDMLDSGITLAFGTDSPVCPTNPLRGIYSAITRCDADTRKPAGEYVPEQAVTLPEALRAYTHGSASAANMESEVGMIAPGMRADLIIWDSNPFEFDEPERLLDSKIRMTIMDGAVRTFD